MNFGTGFRPDTKLFPKDLFPEVTHRTMIGAPAELPLQSDNSDLATVRNQTTGEACTGMELAESLNMSLAGQGHPMDPFSSAGAYWAGRAYGRKLEGLPPDTKLLDVGCAPSFVIAGSQAAGVFDEAVWPYDPSKLEGAEESFAAAVNGAPRRGLMVGAYAAIEEPAGPDLEAAFAAAIAPRGGRVSLAIYASPDFRNADGNRVLSANGTGKSVNHMLGAVAFFTVVSVDGSRGTLSNGDTLDFAFPPEAGDRIYKIQNSWSTSWARGGFVYVDRFFLYESAFQYLVRARVPS